MQTRRQYLHWVATRGDDYHTSQSDDESQCEACSQASAISSQDFGYGGSQGSIGSDRDRNYPILHYRPNDRCKRHRVQDDAEYSEQVVAYRRRKPIH